MPMTSIDNIFLSITRALLVGVMSVALLACIGFLTVSGLSWMKARPGPIPDIAAPSSTALSRSFIQIIQDRERDGQELTNLGDAAPAPETLRFANEATSVIRCFEQFRRTVGLVPLNDDQARSFRNEVEQIFEGYGRDSMLSDRFVDHAAELLCAIYEDERIVRMARDERLPPIFQPALDYYEAAWRRMRADHAELVMDDQARVANARAAALGQAYLAGLALLTFVILAFYLMFAKIESNLRSISLVLKATRDHNSTLEN